MLIQFSFKNYKSFRDDTVLDLSAAKMTEFNNRVVTVGGEKILPVAAIYGANASGFFPLQLFTAQTQAENLIYMRHSIICLSM